MLKDAVFVVHPRHPTIFSSAYTSSQVYYREAFLAAGDHPKQANKRSSSDPSSNGTIIYTTRSIICPCVCKKIYICKSNIEKSKQPIYAKCIQE